jgi:hypothetical protein
MEERAMKNEEEVHPVTSRETGFRSVEARPRNWLVPVILLSLREAMNPGTLYRTLRQMEKDGVVESSWETSRGGPARRMYTITDAGRSYLDFWARSLEQYQQTMDTFFRMYTGRPLQDKPDEKKK